MKFLILIILCSGFITSCSSQSIMPDKDGIKVSRKAADEDCKELGKVSGNAISVKATREQVLEDLKQDAANKGANYVVIKQFSDNGTAATGIAYQCP